MHVHNLLVPIVFVEHGFGVLEEHWNATNEQSGPNDAIVSIRRLSDHRNSMRRRFVAKFDQMLLDIVVGGTGGGDWKMMMLRTVHKSAILMKFVHLRVFGDKFALNYFENDFKTNSMCFKW